MIRSDNFQQDVSEDLSIRQPVMKRESLDANRGKWHSERHTLRHWDFRRESYHLRLIARAARLDLETSGCAHSKQQPLEGARTSRCTPSDTPFGTGTSGENPFTLVSLRGRHGWNRKPPVVPTASNDPLEGARHRSAHRYQLQLLLAARRPGGRRSSFLTNVVRSLSWKSHLRSGDGVSDRGVVSECEEDDDVRTRDFPDSCVTVLNAASRGSHPTITAGACTAPGDTPL
ncbi:hypothetical protein MTO96_051286 [Rhipicephalus appendiculatus]